MTSDRRMYVFSKKPASSVRYMCCSGRMRLSQPKPLNRRSFRRLSGTILLQAIRYVTSVKLIETPSVDRDTLPAVAGLRPHHRAVIEADANDQKRAFCATHRIAYHVFSAAELAGFPEAPSPPNNDRLSSVVHRPSVIVTGCYDWLHSGHVRFFEEVSELRRICMSRRGTTPTSAISKAKAIRCSVRRSAATWSARSATSRRP